MVFNPLAKLADLKPAPLREVFWWTLIITAALLLRLSGLGDRAMSHDESLHAIYSWYLSEQGSYQHDPMMHGPLLFHLNALVYQVLGSNDFSARLVPAFFGTILVGLCFFLRRHIGRIAAATAGLLVAVHPGLLYYSRYLRNDIYICVFTLVLVIASFRYAHSQNRRWLFLFSAALAFSFACKEVTFIHGFILGLIFIGITLVQKQQTGRRLKENPWLDLAIVLLTLALPFATPLGHLALGWDPLDTNELMGQRRTGILWLAALTIASLIASWQFGRLKSYRPSMLTWLLLCLVFWFITLALYTTGFTVFRHGATSAVAGSLGYWLDQHSVGRGHPSPLYYFSILGMYDFMVLTVTAVGVVLAFCSKRIRRSFNLFDGFTLIWILGALAIYSLAGERMPWLSIHISLPLILFSASCTGKLINYLRSGNEHSTLSLVRSAFWVPLFFYLLMYLPTERPFQGSDLNSAHTTFIHLRFTVGLVGMIILLTKMPNRLGGRKQSAVAGLGAVITLFVLMSAVSFRLCFENDELAAEPLVYAHATPDVKPMLAKISQTQQQRLLPVTHTIQCHNDCAWPLSWYFRNQRTSYFETIDQEVMDQTHIMVFPTHELSEIQPLLREDFDLNNYVLVWWPLQDDFTISFARLKRLFSSTHSRQRMWKIIRYRDFEQADLSQWPLRQDFILAIRKKSMS